MSGRSGGDGQRCSKSSSMNDVLVLKTELNCLFRS